MLYNGSHSPEFVDSTLLILNEIAVSDLGHYGSDEKRRLGFSAGIQTKRAIELSLAEPFKIIHLVAEQLQHLDIRYLNKWAKSLGLSDLLAKAYKDTEPPDTP